MHQPALPGVDLGRGVGRRGEADHPASFSHARTQCSRMRARKLNSSVPWPGLKKPGRSEEHTSELQSLMRISYAVFCLKKKKTVQVKITIQPTNISHQQMKKTSHNN